MEIILSKYAGFCEGVARAYDIVEKIAKDPGTKRPIFVLGSLVHNADVVAKIESMGVRKMSADANLIGSPDSFGEKIGTLVITAHGIGPEVFDWAKENDVDVVDTTCPKVIKVQKLAELFSKKGCQIIILGEKDHKEVKGVYGWAGKKALIVETEDDLENLALDGTKKIALVSQTTQNEDFFNQVSGRISEKYPEAEIINTVCQTTHNRQSEIKELASECDVAIIIGSPDSANSTRLFEIAKSINSKAYFIQRADELEQEWFGGAEKVAVTAGASVPKWVIDEVIETLRKI